MVFPIRGRICVTKTVYGNHDARRKRPSLVRETVLPFRRSHRYVIVFGARHSAKVCNRDVKIPGSLSWTQLLSDSRDFIEGQTACVAAAIHNSIWSLAPECLLSPRERITPPAGKRDEKTNECRIASVLPAAETEENNYVRGCRELMPADHTASTLHRTLSPRAKFSRRAPIKSQIHVEPGLLRVNGIRANATGQLPVIVNNYFDCTIT